jgi:flagella basal body P-ring formation protein FlgA
MLSFISILLMVLFGENKQFDAQLKNYLDAKLKSYSKYEYQVMSLPKSYARVEIKDNKEFRINKNYAYIPISVYDKDNFVSSSLLTVRLKLFKEVWVAQSKIEKNVNLTPAMFLVKEENVAVVAGNVFDVSGNLRSVRSKINIREGSVLTQEMVKAIPVVKNGEKLTMHSGKNGVDVSIDVVSRNEGCVGDLINVQGGSTVYKARIIDKSNLMLEE